MDILWYGQSCFKIKGKSTSIITDPYDPQSLNLKLPKDMEANISLSSHDHGDHNNLAAVSGDPIKITGPGEYEVLGVSIVGVGSFHDNTQGSERGKNTIFNIQIDGINIVHLGDLGHLLSEDQISEIGECDLLMVPVGGNYTINAETASKVVASLEPKIVIPMHYSIPESKAEIEGVDPFLKEMGAENITPVNKLSITKDKLPEETQVVLLSKT